VSHSTIQTYREFWAKDLDPDGRKNRPMATRSLSPVTIPFLEKGMVFFLSCDSYSTLKPYNGHALRARYDDTKKDFIIHCHGEPVGRGHPVF